MMITLVGDPRTNEYQAAQTLRERLLAQWPHLEKDRQKQVHIIANVTCHGQSPRDVDLLLIADLGEGEEFHPLWEQKCRQDGVETSSLLSDSVLVRGLCVAIEVKDHDPRSIRFEGARTEVAYRDGWHDASGQAEKQPFSIKKYLEAHGLEAPFIASILWLRNCPVNSEGFPRPPHNILGMKWNWNGFLSAVGTVVPAKWFDRGWNQAPFGQYASTPEEVAAMFLRRQEPSRLDRMRVEHLTLGAASDLKNLPTGEKLVVLRGKGGAGKTSQLLHLAHALYRADDARVLLLTYNRALVADVRRLLALSGISDAPDSRAVAILTIHGFFYEILSTPSLGFDIDRESFLASYTEKQSELLELLRGGAVTPGELRATRAWDFILVDEAQDFPALERDLLIEMFGAHRVIVADGIDQMVRSQTRTVWGEGMPKSEIHREALGPCLRLKSNLVRFINVFCEAMELRVEAVKPHPENGGGQVLIRQTAPGFSSASSPVFWESILESNRKDGNAPVDLLVCVPPSQVSSDNSRENGAEVRAWKGGAALQDAGIEIWDGTASEVRESYPELEELRVVQYESCRGLEGWTVVNLALDEIYEFKRQIYAAELRASRAAGSSDGPLDIEREAHQRAARFCLIPLSRAIDTLVLEFSDPENRCSRALLEAARICGKDFVSLEKVTAETPM